MAAQTEQKRIHFPRHLIPLSVILSLMLVIQNGGAITLGGTAGRCTWSTVNSEWKESEVDGCKTCKCTTLGGDLFEECRTVMRPTAWPSECMRVRRGCEYVIKMKNRDTLCPGWAFTSYIYWVRVSGYSWDKGGRVPGAGQRVDEVGEILMEPHPNFVDNQSTVVLVPSRPGIGPGPTDQTSEVASPNTTVVIQPSAPAAPTPTRPKRRRCRKPSSRRCRKGKKRRRNRKKGKKRHKKRKNNRTAGPLDKRSAPHTTR